MASYGKLLLFALILILSLNNVGAVTTTVVEQYSYPSYTALTDPTYQLGQEIRLTNPHRDAITSVELILKKVGDPGTLDLYIYGHNTYHTSISGSTVGSSCGSVYFDVEYPLRVVSPDESYYIMTIKAVNTNATNYYSWCGSNADPYAGSEAHQLDYIEDTWVATEGSDYAFSFIYDYNQHMNTGATITSPTNGQTGVSLTPTITWSAANDNAAGEAADSPYYYQAGSGGFGSLYAGCETTTSLSCVVQSGELEYNTTYNLIVIAQDSWDHDYGAGDWKNSSTFTFTTMEEPDVNTSSIYNLSVSAVSDSYITWNWTNPSSNYSHVMVYKDGAWVANVSNSSHTVNFNGLDANTNYTIGTRSVSVDGTVNQTWVNLTQKTSIECPVGSVCQLNMSVGITRFLTDISWEQGNTFKLHSADSNYRVSQIDSIQMLLQKYGTPNNPCVTIYTLSGGLPDTELGSDCGDIADVPGVEEGLEWVFVLTSPVSVTDNVEYGFAVSGGVNNSNQLWVFGTQNTFPPYGQLIGKNSSWYTNSSQEVSFIISYTEELVPQGVISYGAVSYNITTKPTINVNLTDPSYFWNDYYARIKYPNGTVFEDVEIPTDSSMPLSFQRFHNVTGTWTVQAIECWLGVCTSPTILGSDTVEIVPNYANSSTVTWLQDIYANGTIAQFNTTLVNPDHDFNDYFVVLKNASGIQVSSSEILSSYPNEVLWNVSIDEVGTWNVTLIECVLGECLYPNTIDSDTVEILDYLAVASSSPSDPVTTYYDINADTFNLTYNRNVSYVNWYNGTTLVQNDTDGNSASLYSAAIANYTPGVYYINTSACVVTGECVTKSWNWTIIDINYTVSGYVFSNGTNPLENALVAVDGYSSTYSDVNGYYLVSDLPNGDYDFNVSALNHLSMEQTITVSFDNRTNVNFSLIGIANYDPSGYVNDSNGYPLENVRVFLYNDSWYDPALVLTNEVGYWSTNIYENGSYHYQINKSGYTALTGDVNLVIGETNVNFTMTLKDSISGTVYRSTVGDVNLNDIVNPIKPIGQTQEYRSEVWNMGSGNNIHFTGLGDSLDCNDDGITDFHDEGYDLPIMYAYKCFVDPRGNILIIDDYSFDGSTVELLFINKNTDESEISTTSFNLNRDGQYAITQLDGSINIIKYSAFAGVENLGLFFTIQTIYPNASPDYFDYYGYESGNNDGLDNMVHVADLGYPRINGAIMYNGGGNIGLKADEARQAIIATVSNEIIDRNNISTSFMRVYYESSNPSISWPIHISRPYFSDNSSFNFLLLKDRATENYVRPQYTGYTTIGTESSYLDILLPTTYVTNYSTYSIDFDGISVLDVELHIKYLVATPTENFKIPLMNVIVSNSIQSVATNEYGAFTIGAISGNNTLWVDGTNAQYIDGSSGDYISKEFEQKSVIYASGVTNATIYLNLSSNNSVVDNYITSNKVTYLSNETIVLSGQYYPVSPLYTRLGVIVPSSLFSAATDVDWAHFYMTDYPHFTAYENTIYKFSYNYNLNPGTYTYELSSQSNTPECVVKPNDIMCYNTVDYVTFVVTPINNVTTGKPDLNISWDKSAYNTGEMAGVHFVNSSSSDILQIYDNNNKLFFEENVLTISPSYKRAFIIPDDSTKLGTWTAKIKNGTNPLDYASATMEVVTDTQWNYSNEYGIDIKWDVRQGTAGTHKLTWFTGTYPNNYTICVEKESGTGVTGTNCLISTKYIGVINKVVYDNYQLTETTKYYATFMSIDGQKMSTAMIQITNDDGTITDPDTGTSGSTDLDAFAINLQWLLAQMFFYGVIIFVLAIVGIAKYAPNSVGLVAIILVNIEALVGLFDPYGSYIIVLSMLIAAISFMVIQRQHT